MADIIKVMRNEYKYLISFTTFRSMCSTFSKLLCEDSHNQDEGYMVRSLYFDSYTNIDYNDKIDGLENRKKIRLRIYNTNSESVKLELKQKIGQSQLKQSLIISREHAIALSKGFYSVLLQYSSDLAKELYFTMNSQCYRPKCIVEYKRIAFILPENDIRLNFDFNILATESNYDLFSNSLNMNHIIEPDYVVLEVKYNRFLLSYLKDLINQCDKKETSLSKYCLSRKLLIS